MNTVKAVKVNEVYMKLIGDYDVLREIYDHFTIEIENLQFHPKVKAKVWDGKIRFLNLRSQLIYVGLYEKLKNFCKENQYTLILDPDIDYQNEFTEKEALDYLKSLNTGFDPYDHQIKAFTKALQKRRVILDSATSSGKSFIIYALCRFLKAKTLIIVPKIQLCHQLESDFKDYSVNNGWSTENNVHKIYQGQDKNSDKQIIISTYQSLLNVDEKWLNQFDVIIGDEAHHFQANSLKKIMDNMINCEYRIGTTGSVQDDNASIYTLLGLFGPIENIIKSKELIDKGLATKLKIVPIILSYDEETKKQLKKEIAQLKKDKKAGKRVKNSYQKEIDFLIENKKRNHFIAKLSGRYENENFLVLYNNVDKKHGEIIKELVNKYYPDRKVHYVSGKISVDKREEIRKEVENSVGNVIVASLGTFSTGINIKNLHKAIVVHPFKAKIRLLQSLGRMLRKHDSKDIAIFFEIVDDLKSGRWTNSTYRQFLYRMEIYNKEEHDINIKKINLE